MTIEQHIKEGYGVDIENADVHYSPNTIRQATNILRKELSFHGVRYENLLDIIKSVFNEPDAVKYNTDEIAKRILDRMIGAD